MADDIIKDINPNIGAYDNLDVLITKSVAVKDFNSDAMLAAVQTMVGSGLARVGTVTDVPNVTTFRVAGFIGLGSTFFRNWGIYVLWKVGGLGAAPQGEMQIASAFNSADGTFTHPAYSITLAIGDKVLLMHPWLIALYNLAGIAPVVGTATANWNTATGTSGEAGEDLVTIGANNLRYKLHSLVLDISALTAGSVVTVKLFQQVNGTERKVYSMTTTRQAQVQGSNPDGLWIVDGTIGIHEALRVEVYSSINESRAIGYDYMLEVM